MTQNQLTVNNVSKTFTVHKRLGFFKREKKVVDALIDFSLVVEPVTIFGLVVPNGVGKTTFIKYCLGLVEKTSGELEVLGYNPYLRKPNFLKQVGLVSGQKQNLDPNLSALESLRLSGYLYDTTPQNIEQRIAYLVDLFETEDKIDVPVRQLSLGQKMKFEIISSVLHEPKFLFMDEPTLGLDFDAQNIMRSLLLKLNKEEGLTILLTSHYLPDITLLCSRLAVIEKGKKVFDGTVKDLMQENGRDGYLKTLIEELNKEEKKNS
ncbi:MAG: ATP-binding cassette domain-containing protein [candidate division SR1 bacterium]|nr:ATP-binding cassette domain-containing protein [candidate division SR1 bacterium]